MNTLNRAARGFFRKLGYKITRLPKGSLAPACQTGPNVAVGLPSVRLRDLLGGDIKICLLEPEQVNGNVSLAELAAINALVARRKAKTVFEFGTFDGRTAMNIAANGAEGCTVYTLDLPQTKMDSAMLALDPSDKQYIDKKAPGLRFRGTPWESKLVQLFGDSASFDYGPYSGRMDAIFIDGSHSYEYVRNDSEIALRLAKNSAVIIWHDYTPFWSSVVRRLEELHASAGVFTDLRHVEGTSLVFLSMTR